jgi:hypothetical protein
MPRTGPRHGEYVPFPRQVLEKDLLAAGVGRRRRDALRKAHSEPDDQLLVDWYGKILEAVYRLEDEVKAKAERDRKRRWKHTGRPRGPV